MNTQICPESIDLKVKGLFSFPRLHGRYHELAPHLVPMDYTNEPDCKIPLALIVNMPELKVNPPTAVLKHCFVNMSSMLVFVELIVNTARLAVLHYIV